MQKMLTFLKKHTAGAIIWAMVALTIVGGGILIALPGLNHPKDLGTRLAYVGRDNWGGCFLWLCESKAYSNYYFATNMDNEELKTYFKGASFAGSEGEAQSNNSDVNSSNTQLYFDLKNDANQGFTLTSYDNVDYIVNSHHLKKTGKTHIIKVLDSSYLIAQSAL